MKIHAKIFGDWRVFDFDAKRVIRHREIQPAPHEHRLLVDGLGNLWPGHQRVLVRIGLNLMPNRCYLTSILRWEHARLLAAHRFF